MCSRLLRALTAMLHAYSFYTNPVRYILALLAIVVIPYLGYILLGGFVFVLLAAGGAYLIYRAYKDSDLRRT